MLKNIKNKQKDILTEKGEKKFITWESLKKLKIAYPPYYELMKEGFISGMGWSFGVTIGFVLISTVVVFLLRQLGGLPIVGAWIADVVEETQNQLLRRNPLYR